MKFLADECCDHHLVKHLRDKGHDVIYIKDVKPGASDTEVLIKAFKDKRILITEDKDFGELVFRLRKPAYGIVLLRFHPMEKKEKLLQMSLLANTWPAKLPGNFVVVTSEKTRLRRLKK